MSHRLPSRLAALVSSTLLAAAAACSGGTSTPQPGSGTVVLVPPYAAIHWSRTQTFSASIDGSPVAVQWSVAGGGAVSPATGTAASATYTAPARSGTYTVQAFDPVSAQTAQAQVAVSAAPLVLTPPSASLRPDQARTFSATLDGSPVAVQWSVAGGGTVSPAAGTATSATYTAPATTGTFTLRAFDPVTVQTGEATVRVAAGVPAPAGAHPRLWMTAAELAAYSASAGVAGSAAKALVDACQRTLDHPEWYIARGAYDSAGTLSRNGDDNTFPSSAVSCAFAYKATGSAAYLAQAIRFWRISIDDAWEAGGTDAYGHTHAEDLAGCSAANVAANDTAAMNIAVTPDGPGYPMRWYGPYISLVYDWLYHEPSLPAGLLSRTQTCLASWIDWYTANGYLADEPGGNYNAGFIAGKFLAATALGADTPAGTRIWSEALDQAVTLVDTGLANRGAPIGSDYGAMVGSDHGEGWQYGPLASLNYTVAIKALELGGASLPELDGWIDGLIVREYHGTVPTFDAQWIGGDYSSATPFAGPAQDQVDAVILGGAQTFANYAAFMKSRQAPYGGSRWVFNAIAEARSTTPVDYRTVAGSRWYFAGGGRTLYARSDWTRDGFWAVFTSPRRKVTDHWHVAAGSFVLARGADALIVDPSVYGEIGTLMTNGVGADWAAAGTWTGYQPSQTPWSRAEMLWARGTSEGVYAARADVASAFYDNTGTQRVPWGLRDWVFFPEGEIVTIDRMTLGAPGRNMYLDFHANTGGGQLAPSGGAYVGPVGSSRVAIHLVYASSGAPVISQPPVRNAYTAHCGACMDARFAHDNYALTVAGLDATAIHVIDGLAAAESPATTASLAADAYNAGVIGASVLRGAQQSYVVASSGAQGSVGASLTYRVPAAGRHVVFDAPADRGRSLVSAAASGGACVVTITAGAGFKGEPLMFSVGSPAAGCAVTELSDVAPASAE